MQSETTERSIGDPARLDALDALAIVDTSPEQGFDDIVRLATRLCAAPVALVSLVALDRQWFKARIGFPHCETDLDRSVCKYALVEPDLLVIPDLAADPRTAANPLVTGEPHIRFYAGAPLRLSCGQVVGSLCVIDTVPRPAGLTDEQADDLRALGRQVSHLLAMRSAVDRRDETLALQRIELRQARRLDILARATEALLGADDPAAVIDPILAANADVLGFDRSYIYDLGPDERHLRLTHSLNSSVEVQGDLRRLPYGAPLCGIVAEQRSPLVLEGLQDNTEPRFANARSIGLDAYAGFPVLSHGRLRGVISFASTRMGAFDAEALAFFEALARLMSAVHERLDGEDKLAETAAYWRGMFERLSEGFIVGEVVRDDAGAIVDWHYREVNYAWGQLVGVNAREAIGRTIREVFPGIEDAWVYEFADVVRTGEPVTFTRQVGALGRWYEGRAFSLGQDRFGVLFLEITERVEAEARRAAQLALGDRLHDLTSMTDMTFAAAEIVGTTLGATRAGYGRVDAAMELVDIDPDWRAPGVSSIAGRHRFADFGDIREDLRNGKPLVIEDVCTDPRTRDNPRALLDIGVGAIVNMPVRDRGATVAVFIVHDDKPHRWSPETLAFLRNVAERLEAGIARMRAEEDQRLLNQEISHRLKNTFAMVLSIASQTLRLVSDRAPVEVFEQRIYALSSAHDILLRKSWTEAPAREVVRSVLSVSGQSDRIAVDGPDVVLGSRATLSLSLALHELATNAVKHGALSVPGGRVDLTWRIDAGPSEQEFVLDWIERGGPLVTPPVAKGGRKGFGSRLIAAGLVGTGGVDLRFRTSGFEATMRAPLSQMQAS